MCLAVSKLRTPSFWQRVSAKEAVCQLGFGFQGSDSFYSQILHCVQDDSPAGVILSGSEESRFMRPITGKVQNESLPFAGLDRCLPIAVSEIVIVLHYLNLLTLIMPPGKVQQLLISSRKVF